VLVSGRTLVRLNAAFIVVLLLTCDAPPRSARAPRDSTRGDSVRMIADSTRLRDSSAPRVVAAPVDSDPPCFASHFGLPCR